MKKAGFDEEAKLSLYKNSDEELKINSSSVILHQFGKDEELNSYIKTVNQNLAEYITDKDKWSYIGWCPFVPDIRYKHLLGFPLEMIAGLLNIDVKNIGDLLMKIKKIEPPKIETVDAPPLPDNLSLEEKVKLLHTRIKEIKPTLKEWESYYEKCAEQVLEQARVFQAIFKEFGQEKK
jgi:hypothetical protein